MAWDEGGAISVWALCLFVAAACVSAAAVDVTHMHAVRAQMQVAADVAAHSALWRRSQGDTPAQAGAEAIRAAARGMPVAEAGPAIAASRILFGAHDQATDRFVVDDASRSAVLVMAERRRTHSNAVPTFRFRMIGVDSMNVVATSVMTAYRPGCLRDGFSVEVLVDLRSNNSFRNGFCIHSNNRVELNSGNRFEHGVTVSMPDLADLGIPSSGVSQNTGLRKAVRPNFYTLRVLDRIRRTDSDPIDVAITQPGNPSRPSYPTSTVINTIAISGNNASATPSSFTRGRVHTATCTGNQKLTFRDGGANQTTFSHMALITNCELQFSGKVNLEDVLIHTTNTSAHSIKANSGGGGDAKALARPRGRPRGRGRHEDLHPRRRQHLLQADHERRADHRARRRELRRPGPGGAARRSCREGRSAAPPTWTSAAAARARRTTSPRPMSGRCGDGGQHGCCARRDGLSASGVWCARRESNPHGPAARRF